MRLAAWGAVGLALILLLCFVWQGPDIFYHLFLGREVLATGSFQPPDHLLVQQPAYRNIYWLFQVVVYFSWAAGGVTGATVLFLLVWTAVVALWARAAGFSSLSSVGPGLTLAGILLFQTRFEPRPETFSYLLLILQIGWLASWRFGTAGAARRLATFGLTEVLWTNIHGYFILGPALAAVRLLAGMIEGEDRRGLRELALLTAVTLAASLLSPFGPGAWGFALTLGRFYHAMRGSITEFLPPTGRFLKLWTVKLFWVAWAGTFTAVLLLLLRRRTGVFAVLLALGGLALSAISARNAPFLLLLGAPLYRRLSGTLSSEGSRSLFIPAGGLRRHRTESPGPGVRGTVLARAGAIGTVLVALALSAWTVQGGFHRSLLSDTWFGIGLSEQAYPLRFADHLRREPWSGRLFNDAADGGFLELRLAGIQPCMDSRYVEAAPVREYFSALTDPAAFDRLDRRLHFDGVLLRVIDSGALAGALLRDPAWEPVWGDLHRVFLKRRSGADRKLLEDRPARDGSRSSDPTACVTFYEGEDLSRNINARSAMQWGALLLQSRDRAGFLRLLAELGSARRVPSYIIQWGLEWGLSGGDREMIERARRLAPRMLAYVPENRLAVERLLEKARMGGMPPSP